MRIIVSILDINNEEKSKKTKKRAENSAIIIPAGIMFYWVYGGILNEKIDAR